jgi:hypothetical protein
VIPWDATLLGELLPSLAPGFGLEESDVQLSRHVLDGACRSACWSPHGHSSQLNDRIVDWHVRVAGERLEIVGSPLDADHARQRILVFGRCLDEIHLRLPRAFCSELDGVVDRATLA